VSPDQSDDPPRADCDVHIAEREKTDEVVGEPAARATRDARSIVAPGSAPLPSGLVQFDQIARRIGKEGLQARSDRHRVGDLDADGTQLGHDSCEVDDSQREMLPVIGRGFALDEMDLLGTRIKPDATDAERGPVRAHAETEHLGVEVERARNVRHVDRYVVQALGAHVLRPSRVIGRRARELVVARSADDPRVRRPRAPRTPRRCVASGAVDRDGRDGPAREHREQAAPRRG